MTVTTTQLADAAEISRRWIRARATADEVPGISFGFSHNNRIVLADALGFADVESSRRASPDQTSYRCASITKTMTATLVMQQVEAGRLRLDEPITTYLEWTRKLPHAKDIDIRHLLIHGGGVIRDGSNHWGDEDFPDRDTLRQEVRQQLTYAEPSTAFRYSNVAYALLGEALEAVTVDTVRGAAATRCPAAARPGRAARRRSRRACARRSRPATTTAVTASRCVRRVTPRRARSRRREGSSRRCRTCSAISRRTSRAGGLVSDLSRREMQRTQWQRNEEPNHGLGWMIWHVDGIGIRGHSGGYPGVRHQDRLLAGPVASRLPCSPTPQPRRPPSPLDVFFHTVSWVDAAMGDAAETAHGHTRTSLGRFTGQYRGDIGEIIVARINRALYLVDPTMTTPLASAARLRPDGARRFTIVEGDDYGHYGEEVSFSVNAAGKATALKYGPHTLRRADI